MPPLWTIPGFPDLTLAIVIRPPAGDAYGPRLVAFRGAEVVHESGRLFDDDFVNPTFFRFGDRTLLLADHGSEDAYDILAWSIESDRIRDLGELAVALPEDIDVFTRGAARHARVERRGDRYLVTIRGPFLVDPRGETEKRVEKTTTFTLPAPP